MTPFSKHLARELAHVDNRSRRGRRNYRLELAAASMGKDRTSSARPMVAGVKPAREDQEYAWPDVIRVLSPGPLFVQGIANGKPVTWDNDAKCWLDEQGVAYDMVLA